MEYAKLQVMNQYCLIEMHIMHMLNWVIERETTLQSIYEIAELFNISDTVIERSKNILLLSIILRENHKYGKYSYALSCVFCAEQIMGYGDIAIDYSNYTEGVHKLKDKIYDLIFNSSALSYN